MIQNVRDGAALNGECGFRATFAEKRIAHAPVLSLRAVGFCADLDINCERETVLGRNY